MHSLSSLEAQLADQSEKSELAYCNLGVCRTETSKMQTEMTEHQTAQSAISPE